MKLNELTKRIKPKRNRLGRGPGSGLGKTSGRGQKGAGSRSGYKRRDTYEGGQYRLFLKLPTRGFSRARFRKPLDPINLKLIDLLYKDGETVNLQTLQDRGLLNGSSHGVKVLAEGETTKKVTIEVAAFSKAAIEKLEKAGIQYKTI
ncbi:MAG: 50S ribosomal protein L15 [Chlamydiae bacterium]|nr:50S ribosomal protein L15 [Chlamydiota bacterium]